MMHLLRATTTAFSVAGVFAIAVHSACAATPTNNPDPPPAIHAPIPVKTTGGGDGNRPGHLGRGPRRCGFGARAAPEHGDTEHGDTEHGDTYNRQGESRRQVLARRFAGLLGRLYFRSGPAPRILDPCFHSVVLPKAAPVLFAAPTNNKHLTLKIISRLRLILSLSNTLLL